MRKLFTLTAILAGFMAKAQTPLPESMHTSALRYVYSISNEEAAAIYKKGIRPAKAEAWLHTLTDSFAVNGTPPALPPGNYLLVYAAENELNIELKQVSPLWVNVINNYRDLAITVHDSTGRLVKDARLQVGRKNISFNEATQSYRSSKCRKAGVLYLTHNGITSLHRIGSTNRRSFWQKIKRSFPVKHISSLFSRRNKKRSRHDYFRGTIPYMQRYSSYMVCSKPRYKPGDTLRFKAFITSKKGQPVNRPLLLRLTQHYYDVDTVMATINPYAPGGYEGMLVLSDSLDLNLDDDFLLTLEELHSRKYDLSTYEGELDDEAYALKRLVLARGGFKFEEYELEQVTFTARASKSVSSPGSSVSVFAKAVDENELAVADGRLEITVLRSDVTHWNLPRMYIPDTLWQHKQPLDAAGETKIVLPDSIFPAASFSYLIDVKFLNSNNETKEQRLYQEHSFSTHSISFKTRGDSLYITYQNRGKEQPVQAGLTAFTDNTATSSETVQLPAAVKISPLHQKYTVATDSISGSYSIARKNGRISFFTSRSKDSVFISTSNPGQLSFWYTLFAGNRAIEKGYTTNLAVKRRTSTRKNYFLLLQYLWAGNIQQENYFIPYMGKTLTIEVEQPSVIYPGQQQQINLLVKDAQGKPVADADVTAWAFTKKFEDAAAPRIPVMSKSYPGLKRRNSYRIEGSSITKGSIQLNWERWSREMGLDSIEYFKFLHPQGGMYRYTEPAEEGLTQIAPFVVKNGNLQPVHLLYIDERPVFFSQAQQLQRYSFAVKPGRHSLRLRTHRRMIKLDSILVQPGAKNIISIEADSATAKMEVLPDTLTNYEKELWKRYMIVITQQYGESMASIQQGSNVLLLPGQYSNGGYYGSQNQLVGPLAENHATLRVKMGFEQDFETEPGYTFSIQKGLIKQKSFTARYPFGSMLTGQKPAVNFKDQVLTLDEVDSLWQQYLDRRAAEEQLFSNPVINGGDPLIIKVDTLANGTTPFVKSIFLFRPDNPDFVRIYRGIQRDLGTLQPGTYRMLLLFKHGQYALYDTVQVRADGWNYFATGLIRPQPRDSTSSRMNNELDQWRRPGYNYNTRFYNDASGIKETFNEAYFNADLFRHTVNGRITDKKGQPVAFAMVKVKGMNRGTAADAGGFFTIRTMPGSTLEISAVGYEYLQKDVNGRTQLDITLAETTSNLGEVVVVAYGAVKKKELTGSVVTVSGKSLESLLAGKVAGVQVTTAAGKPATQIHLRGVSSIAALNTPLYILDGEVFDGDISSIDLDNIASIDVLKDAAATAMYGQAAAGGVIVLTSRKTKIMAADSVATVNTELPNTLRRNFRDDGFWQPRLRTNAQGRAGFTVTFPDDITRWRTFYAAMTGKQSGFAELSVRSFKPLSANLALPQFLVQGDSISLIAKVLNYESDTATASSSFYINDILRQQQNILVANARIDTFSLQVHRADSLKLKYTIAQQSGYFDGEERSIPVYIQGTRETDGIFAMLDKDTSFAIRPFSRNAAITLHAEASVLPVLLDEIEKVKNYEYLCNEQTASKLKALLLEKKIRTQLGQPFKEEKNIKELISRLMQNRGRNFMWGWWADNEPSLWISLHVCEALLQAEAMGYTVNLQKQPIIDYLIYRQESFYREDKIRSLLLLHRLQAKADFKKYADSIAAYHHPQSLYEKLQWIHAKQQLGIPVTADSMLLWASRTMMGNLYWGEEGYRFFDNAVQNTLLAYKILSHSGADESVLKKIRWYFLEKRRTGQWRNTYESAQILEAILPALLADAGGTAAPALQISGSRNITVTSFPFTVKATGADSLVISKKAGLPVYFTAYQQYHNPAPQKAGNGFEVYTSFTHNGSTVSRLKGGQAVSLTATVNVTADADYVMVEIPIPAGCSYRSKEQVYANNEVHREHFKNKISLFCTALKKGRYTFTAELLPRYTGLYQLNPARAEMMYFPVFYGREGMKQVEIY